MTVMVTVAVSLPPVLVAVTVYVVAVLNSVGVPEMVPSVVLKLKPAGSVAEIVHEVTSPPLTLGVTEVIAVPLVSVNEFGLYVRDEGATSLTVMLMVAVSLPPVLVAVTV